MRTYAKGSPRLYSGRYGKSMRGSEIEKVRLQALSPFLIMTGANNAIGLFRLPLFQVAGMLGWTEDEARDTLAAAQDGGLIRYDEDTEWCWVVEHFRHQMGKDPGVKDRKKEDSRIKLIRDLLEDAENASFRDDLIEHHAPFYPYLLHEWIDKTPRRRPVDGPSTPRSIGSGTVATPRLARAHVARARRARGPDQDPDPDQDAEQEQKKGEAPTGASANEAHVGEICSRCEVPVKIDGCLCPDGEPGPRWVSKGSKSIADESRRVGRATRSAPRGADGMAASPDEPREAAGSRSGEHDPTSADPDSVPASRGGGKGNAEDLKELANEAAGSEEGLRRQVKDRKIFDDEGSSQAVQDSRKAAERHPDAPGGGGGGGTTHAMPAAVGSAQSSSKERGSGAVAGGSDGGNGRPLTDHQAAQKRVAEWLDAQEDAEAPRYKINCKGGKKGEIKYGTIGGWLKICGWDPEKLIACLERLRAVDKMENWSYLGKVLPDWSDDAERLRRRRQNGPSEFPPGYQPEPEDDPRYEGDIPFP